MIPSSRQFFRGESGDCFKDCFYFGRNFILKVINFRITTENNSDTIFSTDSAFSFINLCFLLFSLTMQNETEGEFFLQRLL